MALRAVHLVFALILTTSLLMNQVVVTAFQPSSKIHHSSSVPNPSPPTTNYDSRTANVVAVDQQRNTVPITMMVSAWLVSTMMVVSLPLPAWSQQTDIAQGQVLFQANCAGCHAGGNNYVQEKRTLRKDDIQQYRGSTEQAVIANFVQNGMPHKLFPMKMPMEEKEYNDVVAYVLDQALGEKW
jgi:cytochrome c6